MIISVDGVDGTGKTSLCNAVNKELGIVSISSSVRGDMLPEVRKLLNKDVQKYILLRFLYFSSINQLVTNEIKELAKSGKDVILDRSSYSTTAYHVAYDKYYNNGANLSVLQDIDMASSKSLIKPDLAIFLHVSETQRLKRLLRRKNEQNNKSDFESEVLSLVRNEFRTISNDLMKKNHSEVHEINTDELSLLGVAGKVINIIKGHTSKSLQLNDHYGQI